MKKYFDFQLMIRSSVKISNKDDRVKNMIDEKQKRIKIKLTINDFFKLSIFDK